MVRCRNAQSIVFAGTRRSAERRCAVNAVLVALCVLSLGCARGVDQQKFDGVYRSGKSLEAALSVGVNYLRFGELVQAYATEVSIAQDKATNAAERDLVKLYAEALAGCQDSLLIWKLKLDQSGNLNVNSRPELRRIADVYGIEGQGSREYFNFDPDQAIRTIWAVISSKLSNANAVYNGKPTEGGK